MKKISFVIPCYRSEKTIGIVTNQIEQIMKAHKKYDYEIVLVNDCSPDKVVDVIKSLVKNNKKIKGIDLVKNFGQHQALMAGYNYCVGDYVVTLDDDGQTPVVEVFKLIDKVVEGYDVVYAEYEQRQDNLFRKLGTSANNFMSEVLLGKPKELKLTSFFVATKLIIKEICTYKSAFPYVWGLVLRTTKNIANVKIKHSKRIEGESGYTLSKLINLWMNGFTAFSIKPLRISFIMGLIFTVLGFIGVIYFVVDKIFIHPELASGFTTLAAISLIANGLILISLGLIGEYIGRIYMSINQTPQYVVREYIENNGKNKYNKTNN